MVKLKKQVFLLFLLVASLVLNAFFVWEKYEKKTFPASNILTANVLRIIDGDTFDIEGETKARLAGAQAPEYPHGCLGLKAKERLEELILGKKVKIEKVGKDNFGRQLGFVWGERAFCG